MRTVCGIGRRVQALLAGDRAGAATGPPVCAIGGPDYKDLGITHASAMLAPRPPLPTEAALLSGEIGEQRRHGVLLDQVDGRTCGSAVLVALAAWMGQAEITRLGPPSSFASRYDARQRQVHRETNRLWPRALGTTPWGMLSWLRRHVPAAGRYQLRLVDDTAPADIESAVTAATVALAVQRPVPMLVGSLIPRHWVLGLTLHGSAHGGWRVYEPSSGSVRVVDPAWVSSRALRPTLGFPRLHALLLPTPEPDPTHT